MKAGEVAQELVRLHKGQRGHTRVGKGAEELARVQKSWRGHTRAGEVAQCHTISHDAPGPFTTS
jgi:hypothetical protein